MYISRFAAVALAFLLYSTTMCRWIGAGDTAIVVWNMDQAILSSHVNNHPAMVAIGWLMMQLAPSASPAFVANWFSVIFSTLTIGLFHTVISRWVREPAHALLATLVVVVTHTVWWHATIVENYSLNGVMLLTVTWMLFRDHETRNIRWMYGASVVAGLAVLNHAQMGFLAPLLGAYALVRDPFKATQVLQRWVLLALGWLVGLIPFFALIARNIQGGHKSEVVVKNAMGSYFTEIMFDLRLWEIGSIFWREVFVQFPSPVLLLLPFGMVAAFYKNERWPVHFGLMGGWLVNSGFFMLYHTWDRFAFLLPSYLLLLLWLTEGWAVVLRKADEGKPWLKHLALAVGLSGVILPPLVYRELPRLGRAGVFWHGRFSSNSQWNTHDVGTYLANPDKSAWNDLDRVNRLLLDQLPERSVVIDDDGRNHYTLQLYFQKVLGERTDIRATLVNAWGFEGWGQDKTTLANKIVRWRRNAPVYAMSLMPPHRKWQGDLAERGIGPVPLYVADDVWIYEFKDRPRASAEPFLWEVMTGVRLEGDQMLSHQFGPDDEAQVRLRYVKTEQEHQATVRWTHADGTTLDQQMTLKAQTERAVLPMPEAVLATPGRWKIEAVIEGQVDTWLFVEIRDHAIDRRYR